jgi:ribosome biogenesis protein ENP2
VYEDYRFVSREELQQLGLGGLVGTNMVKAYMHGFFIDTQLYGRAKSVAQPFAYDEYRKQKVSSHSNTVVVY